MKKILFNTLDREYKKFKKEYDKAFYTVMKSGWYILGKEVEEFEQNFAKFIGTKYCVGLNSGLDALILALKAIAISENDEVIVPANTYIATIMAVTLNKARPVFVEPNEFYNIDVEKIEKAITKNTKAILVVHLYGQTSNMEEINKIAKKHNLYVVEDCAQSHGSKFNGKTSGSTSHIGCFSFYPTKNMGAFGDAGAIVTNNKDIEKKIRTLRNYGSQKRYFNEYIGVNSRLDSLQASFLKIKLSHFDMLLKNRYKIVDFYRKEIDNDKIILPKIDLNSTSVWHLFVIRTLNRDHFMEYMASNGIDTIIHYPIPPHLQKAYEYLNKKEGDYPITENYSKTMVSLPLYDWMTIKEAKKVVEVINRYV